jgi:hypothetical protein
MHLPLLLGLLLQASPLRSCAIEWAVVGMSCHDQDAQPGLQDSSGIATDCADHDGQCVCQIERHIASIAAAQLLGLHAFPLQERVFDIRISATSPPVCTTVFDHLHSPASSTSLPLLT